jgi:DNA-binding response OmpR family regulator
MIKILYVEDEPFLGRIVKESLESRGFAVEMRTDGHDIVSIFRNFKPDICLLDIMLPQRDGYELAQDLRAENAIIPIIFLTAKSQTEDVLKGFQAGGNDYIRKPFSVEELIVRIHNLLHLAQPQTDTKKGISFGSFVFYPQRYELHTSERVKKLSYRETELLRLLCENRYEPINRRDILLQLWGDDSFFNSRNLDVYINKLRETLRSDTNVQIITIKGVGYHFVVA